MNSGLEPGLKTVLDAVDFEIEHLRNQASGWTTWALLPALAGLLWLFLDQLANPVSTHTVARTFFVLSVALDLILGGAGMIAGKVAPARSGNRWISTRNFLDVSLSGRLDLSLGIGLLFLYLWLALRYWPDVTRVTTVWAFLYFGLLIPILLIFLVGMLLDMDLRVNQPQKPWTVLLAWGYLGLGLWLVISYTRALIGGTPPSVTEWKVAGILVAIRVLVSFLARIMRQPILLQELVTLRRDIVFGRTDSDRALHHLDIVVAGMQESDRLQRKVEKVMTLLREHQNECRAMVDESAAMRASLTGPQSPKKTAITMNSLKKWYNEHHATLTARVDKIVREVTKSNRRARAIVAGSPSAEAMWRDIDAQVDRELESVARQSEEMHKSVDELLRELITSERSPSAPPTQGSTSAETTKQ
jgi:hypothetical protein